MDNKESEQIIRETIEYANKEIQKTKRRSRWLLCGIILGMLALLLGWRILFHYEIPVPYRDGLVNVEIPEDQGLDIHVELPNYQKANAVLVKTGDGTYDLYIGVMQTAATKMMKDTDTANNFLRVGNGILFDHQGERLLGFLPEGNGPEAIGHIYYLDNLSEEIMTKTDQELIACTEKTLIWGRDA